MSTVSADRGIAVPDGSFWLAVRAGGRICLIPLPLVVEVMRPLDLVPLAGAPDFVTGVSIVRGEPLPVVDARLLLGQEAVDPPRRLVTLRCQDRAVALAVDEVAGVQPMSERDVRILPPLLQGLREVSERLGVLDGQLLTVLDAARVVDRALSALA
jgi:purine-binding chemotaxis protein CheW